MVSDKTDAGPPFGPHGQGCGHGVSEGVVVKGCPATMLGFLMLLRAMPQSVKVSEEELLCLRLRVWEAAERSADGKSDWKR